MPQQNANANRTEDLNRNLAWSEFMQIGRRELGEHFASLNDEELLDLKREELTETAQGIYDKEIAHRELDRKLSVKTEIEKTETSFSEPNQLREDEIVDPDWHQDGVLVCSFVDTPGSNAAEKVSNAQKALQAAGIPSHLKAKRELAASGKPDPFDTLEILAPVRYAMHAASILNRDLFNDEFETYWRDHLIILSNEDLLALDPDIFCAGLLDQLARMKKAYAEEMKKRNLKARSL
jgi:hypothetical protein